MQRYLLIKLSSVAMLAFALAACGEPTPEDRLLETGEDVSEAESSLESLNQSIESHEDALDRLREQRRKARARLQTLEERLQQRATDLAIFRAAQSALLDEPRLQQSVVMASVEDGAVTLGGLVSSSVEKQLAETIVSGLPGVESVVVRIQVEETPDAAAQ